MDIEIPQNLISTLRGKFLLLDTNVFIDASIHWEVFQKFFNELKSVNITLVTIDLVKAEFLRGAEDTTSYATKELLLEGVVNTILSTEGKTLTNIFEIVKRYKADGKTVEIPDLVLGANLLRYGSNLFLLTRNTNDFPIKVYDVVGVINCIYKRGIFAYGVYKIKSY